MSKIKVSVGPCFLWILSFLAFSSFLWLLAISSAPRLIDGHSNLCFLSPGLLLVCACVHAQIFLLRVRTQVTFS